jgi:chemotaxis regulatin CheY-phosphate phosphatase CheZ
MATDRAQALYYDSVATLRLVDTQLDDLRDGDLAPAPVTESAAAPATVRPRLAVTLADLPHLLERANDEINGLLERLRQSRGALQATAVDKLSHTQDKLREVTSATELAAIDIMDACDRATAKLDALDELEGAADYDRARASVLHTELRDELFTMMAALQFQDLTTQMLSHANSVLTEVEGRLQDVAKIFEGTIVTEQITSLSSPPASLTFDPNATVRDADKRQAVADSVFGSAEIAAA